MKRLTLFLLLTGCIVPQIFAQLNHLVVYTNEPEPFFLIVNGIRQNDVAQTNVRITQLEGDFHRVRVVFQNSNLSDVDQSVTFLESGKEISLEVIRRKKGMRIRFAGERSITSSVANSGQVEVPYSPTMPQAPVRPAGSGEVDPMPQAPARPISSGNASQMPQAPSQPISNQGTGATAQTQVSGGTNQTNISMNTQVNEGMNTEGASVNISVNESGFNMNVQVTESNTTHNSGMSGNNTQISNNQGNNTGMNSGSTNNPSGSGMHSGNNSGSLTGVSRPSDNTGNTNSGSLDGVNRPNNNMPTRPTGTVQPMSHTWVPNYSGLIGCNVKPLMNVDQVKKSALNESFTPSRFSVVENALETNCMTVEQVMSLSEVFTFEDDKMKFVKLAYQHTYDIDNYFDLANIFTFSSSKEEFNTFMKVNRR